MGRTSNLRPLIRIAVPPGAGARSGNWISATRWGRLLKDLGYRTQVREDWAGEPADCLVALHARRNARAAQAFRRAYPDRPLVVVLTGTDLYRDLRTHASARRSLMLADRLVVLQSEAIEALPTAVRDRAHVIYQSARPLQPAPAPRLRSFDVACVGHLRTVKDPMRAAMACRALPLTSRIQVIHAGAATTPALEARATQETEQNARYTWVGNLTPSNAHRLIARCRVLVVSSRMEGGANVIAVAVVNRTPILASRVSGNIGMLGGEYPGYFECGNTTALTELLQRCERDPSFLRTLQTLCDARRHRFMETDEREGFAKLMSSLFSRSRHELPRLI
jgi:putative glycosyltransferase (TIGR04348 family)